MTAAWKVAAQGGDVASLEELLAAGYDIDAKDQHGQTALMVAARKGHTAAARLLIARGAELDHTAKFHLTALMLAVLNGQVAIVRELVEAGADVTVRGSGAPGFHDKTALDLAVVRERDEAVAQQLDEIARIVAAAQATSRPASRRGRDGRAP